MAKVCWTKNKRFLKKHTGVQLAAMFIHFHKHCRSTGAWRKANAIQGFPRQFVEYHIISFLTTLVVGTSDFQTFLTQRYVFLFAVLKATERYCHLLQAHHPALKFFYS
jgi:hypothetical protein